jgi:hypothetical protein
VGHAAVDVAALLLPSVGAAVCGRDPSVGMLLLRGLLQEAVLLLVLMPAVLTGSLLLWEPVRMSQDTEAPTAAGGHTSRRCTMGEPRPVPPCGLGSGCSTDAKFRFKFKPPGQTPGCTEGVAPGAEGMRLRDVGAALGVVLRRSTCSCRLSASSRATSCCASASASLQ